MRGSYVNRIAWTLILAVVAFWIWFGAASAASERSGWGNVAAHLLVPGGLFALIAAIAWRWRTIGAILMIAAGAVIVVGYPIVAGKIFPLSTIVFGLLTIAAPPIAAGVLLLEARHVARRAG
jgi:hypothetical protein